MHEDEPLDSEIIETADTKPFMLPIKYLGELPIDIGIVLITVAMMGVVQWFWRGAIWFPFVWFILANWVIAYDFHAITKIKLWQRYTMPTLDYHKWKGVSVTPFPVRRKIPLGMIGGE